MKNHNLDNGGGRGRLFGEIVVMGLEMAVMMMIFQIQQFV